MLNLKLAPFIEKFRVSYWLIPTCMVIAFFIISVLCIYIDFHSGANVITNLFYGIDTQAIRSLLTIIAGSMITVTSIAFSITIVTLTIASSQFGPRLMRNFMTDLGTQVVLGMFISTFLFCLFINFALSFEPSYSFKPGLSALVAMMMSVISVFMLIFFIHHVAKSIQVDVVIDDVYSDLQANIVKYFPSKMNATPQNKQQEAFALIELKNSKVNLIIKAATSGYVQLIDKEMIIQVATQHHVTIKLIHSAGDFIIKGAPIMWVLSTDDRTMNCDVRNQLRSHVVLGSCRTPVQDPEFALHQLVEIALRALSPGINDPYTAMTCIDKLCAILCELTDKAFPSPMTFDDNNELRLVAKELTFYDIAQAGFHQIREHSKNNIQVTIRILDALLALMQQVTCSEQSKFVLVQTTMIQQQQLKENATQHERQVIQRRIDKIVNYKGGRSIISPFY